MKKLKTILTLAVIVASLSSCTVTMPYAVTEHPIGDKKGVSSTTVLFGVIQLNGDYGIADAAKNGKIKGPISTVDIRTTSYLGAIFFKKELLVTGDAE